MRNIILVALLTVAFMEVGLRVCGFGPRGDETRRPGIIVTLRDDRLGWRNEPGLHTLRSLHGEGEPIIQRIFSSGARATRLDENSRGPKVVLLGGSYMYGYGLNDHETLGWKLQSLFPSLDILNFGVSGYGTYQSLLMMEDLLNKWPQVPVLFIYGFIDQHEMRNTGDPRWQAIVAASCSDWNCFMPFCRLRNDSSLERVPSRWFYPNIWLRDRLASVAALEEIYVRLRDMPRMRMARPVTELLLQEMNSKASNSYSRLLVALWEMKENDRQHYEGFLGSKGVSYINCIHPGAKTERTTIAEDSLHPNAEVNSFWAECLRPHLEGIAGDV